MPRPGWYNDNINRSFPFLVGKVGNAYSGTLTSLKNLPDYFIVDCGFTFGDDVEFEAVTDSFYLSRLSRSGGVIEFVFKSDASELSKYPIRFTRTIFDMEYSVEYVDSDSPDSPESTSESIPETCRQPFWSGYLVTGDMSLIADALIDGMTIEEDGVAIVEPSLVQNLSGTQLSSLSLANDDRTRATSPCIPEEDQYEWPFAILPEGESYEIKRCITGDVRFKPGYNVSISVDQNTNTILFGVGVGTGEGTPCEEVKVFPTEVGPLAASTPFSNSLLEGGPLCNELVRSINGMGGPLVQIQGGQGVIIIPDPGENKIIIDVNLNNMDLCAFSTYSIG